MGSVLARGSKKRRRSADAAEKRLQIAAVGMRRYANRLLREAGDGESLPCAVSGEDFECKLALLENIIIATQRMSSNVRAATLIMSMIETLRWPVAGVKPIKRWRMAQMQYRQYK